MRLKNSVKAIILVNNNKADNTVTKQTYTDTTIIYNSTTQNGGVFFNNELHNIQPDNATIVGFFNKHHHLNSEKSIEKVVELFINYPYLSCIYTDNYINHTNYQLYGLLLQHNYDMAQQIINTPLFIRYTSSIEFNEQLEYLELYDMLIKFNNSGVYVYHLAECLCSTDHTNINIEKDIQILHATYTQNQKQ